MDFELQHHVAGRGLARVKCSHTYPEYGAGKCVRIAGHCVWAWDVAEMRVTRRMHVSWHLCSCQLLVWHGQREALGQVCWVVVIRVPTRKLMIPRNWAHHSIKYWYKLVIYFINKHQSRSSDDEPYKIAIFAQVTYLKVNALVCGLTGHSSR